ncbi:hypothetical protein AC249_AIPGENE23163 [Exaiptasia diaphana]|nr:hypothetical protein AC249_AIPGENE23163 [Exaiptasia diaphana]
MESEDDFQPAKRFRKARTTEEEKEMLEKAIPKSTRYKNTWAFKLFEDWKSERANKTAILEASSVNSKLEELENLDQDFILMKPKSLNFWVGKFIQEVTSKDGKRFPGATLYQIVAGLKRFLEEHNRNDVNMLDKQKPEVYAREDALESQTLESTVLIDEIEKDLHSLQNYKDTHSHMFDVSPELKHFASTYILPVAGDWPTWYFHKKDICLSEENINMIPELGPFHVYLNSTEDVIKGYHPVFEELYKSVFGEKKILPLKPKPEKVSLCITLAFAGWLQIRDAILNAFGECKDVEYACLFHLFDELVPLTFLHYPVFVKGNDFNNVHVSMKRLAVMFITMERHHYNKASLSWISDSHYQRNYFPDYYTAKQHLCSVISEKKVEIFHSRLRSRISKTDKAPKIQETAKLLARSNCQPNHFEQDYVNGYKRGISDQDLLFLTGLAAESLLNMFEKYLPLGYRWPATQPNGDLDCDFKDCRGFDGKIKRLTCGHTYHIQCLQNNQCKVCLGNIIKDVEKLSKSWNTQLLKPVAEDKNLCADDNDDEGGDGPDDNDYTIPKKKDAKYFKSVSFKKHIKNASSKILDIINKSKLKLEE